MSDPHEERRSRWIRETEHLEYEGTVWVEEKSVHALLDRELVRERRRNAIRLCKHCEDDKPFRDRETNAFMHQVYINKSPTVRILEMVPCYADVLWRNEDQ